MGRGYCQNSAIPQLADVNNVDEGEEDGYYMEGIHMEILKAIDEKKEELELET